MLQSFVRPVLLLLAVALNASAFCAVWCHPEQPERSECRHHDAATSGIRTGDDTCSTPSGAAARFVREEPTRGPSTAGHQQAILVPALLHAESPACTSLVERSLISPDAGPPPSLIALRI